MTRISAGLFVLLAASFAVAAFVPADALLPNESVASSYGISLGASRYTLAFGSRGSAFFYDDHGVVDNPATVASLASSAAGLAQQARLNASLVAAATSFAVSECVAAYDDFTNSRYVCYDEFYHKYQCAYLWSQGFWREILSFNIGNVKLDVTRELPIMTLESGKAKTAVDSGDVAGFASAAAAFNASLSNFSAANALMLSVRPFRVDARLSRCNITAADGTALVAHSLVLSALGSDLGASSRAALSRWQARPGPAAIAAAKARLSTYLSDALKANESIALVNRTFLLFIEPDYAAANASLDAVVFSTSDRNVKDFNATMARVESKVRAAVAVSKSYGAATSALSLWAGLLQQVPDNESRVKFDDAAKRYYSFESSLAIGSVPSASDFDSIRSDADGEVKKLSAVRDAVQTAPEVPAWLVAAAFVGVAILFGAAAWVKTRKN